MGKDLHKKGIKNITDEKSEKIHCNTRKNITSEIAHPFKNLLLGLEFNLKLYAYSSSDQFRTLINCQKIHYQPNSFTHSLTNLLLLGLLGPFPLPISFGSGLKFVTLQYICNRSFFIIKKKKFNVTIVKHSKWFFL